MAKIKIVTYTVNGKAVVKEIEKSVWDKPEGKNKLMVNALKGKGFKELKPGESVVIKATMPGEKDLKISRKPEVKAAELPIANTKPE